MIAEIENAIIARFAAAGEAGVLGYKYKTKETYPANWDEYLRDKTIRAPGVWAVFAGFSRGESVSFGNLQIEASFGVVVMAENARNEQAQRHGGPTDAEPGSYQLAMDAIALLQGQDLGLGIGSFEIRSVRPVRTQAIVTDRKVSMYAIELCTKLLLAGNSDPGAAAIGDFATFHSNWDVPPFGGIEPIPDDADADATDNVTLETAP